MLEGYVTMLDPFQLKLSENGRLALIPALPESLWTATESSWYIQKCSLLPYIKEYFVTVQFVSEPVAPEFGL